MPADFLSVNDIQNNLVKKIDKTKPINTVKAQQEFSAMQQVISKFFQVPLQGSVTTTNKVFKLPQSEDNSQEDYLSNTYSISSINIISHGSNTSLIREDFKSDPYSNMYFINTGEANSKQSFSISSEAEIDDGSFTADITKGSASAENLGNSDPTVIDEINYKATIPLNFRVNDEGDVFLIAGNLPEKKLFNINDSEKVKNEKELYSYSDFIN